MAIRELVVILIVTSCGFSERSRFAETENPSNIVTFTIEQGHGPKPWNSEDAPLAVKVGQILRIVNNDTTNQTLHTTGGEPCPHGGDRVFDAAGTLLYEGFNVKPIPTGGWLECEIRALPTKELLLYNHFAGSSARFYLLITEE